MITDTVADSDGIRVIAGDIVVGTDAVVEVVCSGSCANADTDKVHVHGATCMGLSTYVCECCTGSGITFEGTELEPPIILNK